MPCLCKNSLKLTRVCKLIGLFFFFLFFFFFVPIFFFFSFQTLLDDRNLSSLDMWCFLPPPTLSTVIQQVNKLFCHFRLSVSGWGAILIIIVYFNCKYLYFFISFRQVILLYIFLYFCNFQIFKLSPTSSHLCEYGISFEIHWATDLFWWLLCERVFRIIVLLWWIFIEACIESVNGTS